MVLFELKPFWYRLYKIQNSLVITNFTSSHEQAYTKIEQIHTFIIPLSFPDRGSSTTGFVGSHDLNEKTNSFNRRRKRKGRGMPLIG